MKMQGIILLKHFVATEVGDTFPQHFNIGTIFIVDNIRVQQNTIKTIIRTKKFKFLWSCSIYKICEKEGIGRVTALRQLSYRKIQIFIFSMC